MHNLLLELVHPLFDLNLIHRYCSNREVFEKMHILDGPDYTRRAKTKIAICREKSKILNFQEPKQFSSWYINKNISPIGKCFI